MFGMDRSNQRPLAGTGPQLPPPGWDAGPGPLHRRLADALESAILRGELAAGAGLPTERELARRASVSRATAAEAYRRLKAAGRIDSRQGRGTWVVGVPAPAGRAPAAAMGPVLDAAPDVVDLALAAVEVDAFVQAALEHAIDAARVDLSRPGSVLSGPGYAPGGLDALRAGLGGRPEEVLVTAGAQHALALVVEELVRPGEVVVVEEVTYVGALDAARRVGARLVAVPTGPGGVDVDALVDAIERHRPAAVYLNPTHHSPIGSILDDAGRARIVEACLRTATTVIDDRTLADLGADDGPRPRPLRTFDIAAPVVTVGSLSKVVWAGLRVGWVRADPALVVRLLRRRTVDDLGGDLLAHLVALHLLDRLPELARHRADQLAARHRHLVAALQRDLPTWEVAPSRGGIAAWVRLPTANADAVADRAAAHGVHVVAGPLLSPHGGMADHLRLVVTPPEAVLDDGVRRLAAAWGELDPSRR